MNSIAAGNLIIDVLFILHLHIFIHNEDKDIFDWIITILGFIVIILNFKNI